MELTIILFIAFIVLNCAIKLSLWHRWQQLAYSMLMGAWTWWSLRFAVELSKSRVAELLNDDGALQTLALLVTVESAVGIGFCLHWLNSGGGFLHKKTFGRWLYAYGSLLMFPVAFYLLAQAVFLATGIDFETIGMTVAASIAATLLLLAEGARRLVPMTDERIELHLLLTVFVLVLGLVCTQRVRMVYAVGEAPANWLGMALTVAGFAVVGLAGFLLDRMKWKVKK